jgi:Ca2+-binding RTX toxin-like protein
MRTSFRLVLAGFAVSAAVALSLPAAGLTQSTAELCADAQPGVVNCGPGNNRKAPGGGGAGKVPHNDGLNSKSPATRSWPALSGILWQVVEDSKTPRTQAGGPLNDELLGHHGTDRLSGGGGHDILWGDWDPVANNSAQRDVLDGGPGNDWLYPSHGRSIVKGGAGADYVWAYYGKGTIDCGPGIDTARIRTNGAFKTKGCEKIRHFCANGENTQGQCLSPTGKPVAASRRLG